MPELPEVETIACQLKLLLSGKKVKRLVILDEKLDGAYDMLAGARVASVQRTGKQVAIRITRGKTEAWWLFVHLRMTGRLIWSGEHSGFDTKQLLIRGKGTVDSTFQKHVRAKVIFEDGELLFHDVRRFGTLKISSEPLAPGIAIEPLSEACSVRWLSDSLSRSRQNIKQYLLRQDRLAGIGNIYASEILFTSGISPLRRSDSIAPGEVHLLRKAIRNILNKAIKCSGTTFSDYLDASGEAGAFQRYLKVYDREGKPCRRCGARIKRVKQGGRSTFFCPRCQR